MSQSCTTQRSSARGNFITSKRYKLKRLDVVQPSDPSFKYIPLTQEQVATVDAEDYDRLMEFSWYAHWSPGTKSFYAVRDHKLDGKRVSTGMHREVLGYSGDLHVDHINGDTLANRKGNLRVATASQNQWNTGKRSDNVSGYKGVYWEAKRGKWAAYIHHNGKGRHLGYFSSPEKAHEAYIAASVNLRGEFVRAEPDNTNTNEVYLSQ